MTLDQQIKQARDGVVKAQKVFDKAQLIQSEADLDLGNAVSKLMILLFKKAEQQQRQFQPVECVS